MKLPIHKIKLNPDNPRVITDAKFKKLVKSLKDFPEMSEVREIILNKDLVILGGNMRFKAMVEAGWKEVPVRIVDWSEKKQKEFIVKDNVGYGEHDFAALAKGWEIPELEDWGVDFAAPDGFGKNPDPNKFEAPANVDKLNLHIANFDSDNSFDLPVIKKSTTLPKELERFNGASDLAKAEKGNALHFFAMDYKFESLWANPHHCLEEIKKLGLVLSPDFTFPVDAPIPAQLWQTFRNRWLGAWWNENGVEVIPTIGWNNDIFDMCFMGVEKGSNVAISTVGVDDVGTFVAGYEQMVKYIDPAKVICYGSISRFGIKDDRIIEYETRWKDFNKKGKSDG